MNSLGAMMKRRIVATCACGAIALTAGGAWSASALASEGPTEPPPDTIVKIEGDAENGFTIHHYDGSTLSPPTDSEALAECAEYDTAAQRIKCKTEVLTWYRDLADTKQAIDWAKRSTRSR